VKRLLVTGYKASELGIFSLKHPGIDMIKKAIKKKLIPLMDEGLEWVIVSGQWGVELWAAEAAIELRETFEGLQLAVICPFLGQEENWSDPKKEKYEAVLRQANYVNSVTKSKYEGPWQFREKNKFLLRNSDGMLLVYDEDKEGSPKYMKEQGVRLAQTREYRILTINEQDLQSIAEEEQMNQW